MKTLKFAFKFITILVVIYITLKIVIFLMLCFESYRFRTYVDRNKLAEFTIAYEDQNMKICLSERNIFSFWYSGGYKRFCYIKLNNQCSIVHSGDLVHVMRLYKDSKSIEQFEESISHLPNLYKDGYFSFCIPVIYE